MAARLIIEVGAVWPWQECMKWPAHNVIAEVEYITVHVCNAAEVGGLRLSPFHCYRDAFRTAPVSSTYLSVRA